MPTPSRARPAGRRPFTPRVLLVLLAGAACSGPSPSPTQPEGSTGSATTDPAGTTLGDATAASEGPGATGSATSASSTGAIATTTASTDSTGSDPTTASTGTDPTTAGESTGSSPDMPCAEGCAVEVACTERWRTEQACIDACEANLVEATAFEPACAAAWADLHACLGTLTCEELAQWTQPTAFPYPCVSEDEVLGFECAGQ